MGRRWWGAFWALGLAAGTPSTPSTASFEPASLATATRLEAQGEFRAAARLLVDSLPATAATRDVARARLRCALQERDPAGARLALADLDPESRGIVEAALALDADTPRAALDALHRAAPPLGVEIYAAALEAQAAARAGAWDAALAAAERARAGTLPIELQQRLLVVRARAALGRGDSLLVRTLAGDLGEAARRDDRTGLALAELARAAAAAGRRDWARTWRLALLESRPTPAESAYVALCTEADTIAATAAVLQLARFEVRSQRFERAAARLRTAIGTARTAASRAELGRALAECQLKRGEPERALPALAAAEPAARGTHVAPELVRLRARALRQMGRRTETIAAYRELARRFPAHALADDALYEVGWLHETRGALRSAEHAYLVCARTYRHGPLADDALLRAGLCALRDGRPGVALEHLRRALARHADSPLADNLLYWQMVAHQERRDPASALAVRDRLARDFPRSYYTTLARARVERGLAPHAAEATSPPPPVADEPPRARAVRLASTYDDALRALQALPGLAPPPTWERETRLWRFLLDHGLVVEAGWEAQRLEKLYDGDPGGLLGLAAASHARGAHGRLVRLAWRLSKQVADPAARDALEVLLYPAPLGETLAQRAAPAGLSHATLLGLMRQESAFDARIDSRAGARGLMQLMPAVGERLSREAGRTGFHPDDLYRPEINVELGMRLFAAELGQAGGRLAQALAAYNAGADRAAEWTKRLRSHEPEELYLDLAEFYETRDYLKSVLGNAEVYRRLYGLP